MVGRGVGDEPAAAPLDEVGGGATTTAALEAELAGASDAGATVGAMMTVTEVVGDGTTVDVAMLLTVTGTVSPGPIVAMGCRAGTDPLLSA